MCVCVCVCVCVYIYIYIFYFIIIILIFGHTSQHVDLSSLTRDGTWAPMLEGPGLPGKSHSANAGTSGHPLCPTLYRADGLSHSTPYLFE